MCIFEITDSRILSVYGPIKMKILGQIRE